MWYNAPNIEKEVLMLVLILVNSFLLRVILGLVEKKNYEKESKRGLGAWGEKNKKQFFFCLINYNLFLECSVLYLLQSIALLNDQKTGLHSKKDEAFHRDVVRDL